eukprot:scaffold51684_cov72-Phaeocystis_antarctica.AAC.5
MVGDELRRRHGDGMVKLAAEFIQDGRPVLCLLPPANQILERGASCAAGRLATASVWYQFLLRVDPASIKVHAIPRGGEVCSHHVKAEGFNSIVIVKPWPFEDIQDAQKYILSFKGRDLH